MAECDPVGSDNHEDLGEGTSEDIKYCPLRATQTWEEVKISSDLNQDQQREVRDLL